VLKQDFRSAACAINGQMGVDSSGKMLAEAAEFEECDELTDDQISAAFSIKRQMGATAMFWLRKGGSSGIRWIFLGRAEMGSSRGVFNVSQLEHQRCCSP